MSIAVIANGTLLKVDDGAGNFTTVPEVARLSGPSIRFDLLDVTSHDSEGFFREFIPGLADGDRITADLHWRPSNAIHKQIRVDQYARTLRKFKIVFPDTTDNTVDMDTYIEGMPPKADIGTPLMASLSLKITGEPDWS